MKKKIYVAGKMKGLRNLGYQKFFDKTEELNKLGWEAINPAIYPYEGVTTTIREDGKLDVDVDKNIIDEFTYHKVLYRDFILIEECDAIYMMTGWQTSSGASCELAYAKLRGKEVIFETKGDGYKARVVPYKPK